MIGKDDGGDQEKVRNLGGRSFQRRVSRQSVKTVINPAYFR